MNLARATADDEPVVFPDDDTALVARARLDIRDFAPLYDRHFDGVYGFCLRRLLDRDAAADATSQTFWLAMRRLESWRGPSFAAWLFRIARNVVIDDVRQRRPIATVDPAVLDDLVDDTMPVDEQVVAREQHLRLAVAIRHLTPEKRQIVELRLAGLGGGEIAATLGISPAAVHSGQYRAYRALRRLLRADPQFGADR